MTVREPPSNGRSRRIRYQRSWGTLIKDVRERRQFTRGQLIARFQAELASIDPEYDYTEVISEPWLSRAEKNGVANVDQRTLHLICRALQCTFIEQMQIMLAAERNMLLNDNGEMTEELLLMIFTARSLYADPVVRKLVRKLMHNRRFFDLSESDRNAIIAEVLKVVKASDGDSSNAGENNGSAPPADQDVHRAREYGASEAEQRSNGVEDLQSSDGYTGDSSAAQGGN